MAYSWKNGILGGVSVAESATAGTPLATLVAQDGGVVDAFYYTLTGQDSSLFNIDLYGRLSLKQAIDYDTTGGTSWWRTADGQWHAPDHRYTVVVNAFNDADQRQITTTFILTVGNVNDNPTNFAWVQQPIGVNQWRNAASGLITVNVNENNAVGMAVGQFSAIDGDGGASVNYSLSGADAGYFDINNNGTLSLRSRLDYESAHAKNYSVTVTATSTDGSPAVNSLFVLSLNNVDDNATAWNVSPTTGIAVNETTGITNTVVRSTLESLANFSAVDADGQTVKYGLSGDSWMFSIDSNGTLYRTNDVDYETSTSWRASHQFSVTVWAWGAKNTGGITNEGAGIGKLFILTINNVNEFATGFKWAEQPMWGQNSAGAWNNWAAASDTRIVNISENNAVGMAVGQFAATDGDGVAVTYSLSGVDAGYFDINNNGTLTLRSSLDYESTHVGKNYSVTVVATSTDGSSAVNSLFVVSLQDNTKEFGWTATQGSITSISETAALVGVTVADFNIAAVDNGAAFAEGISSSYSLTGGDTWAFSINKQTGALMLKQPRDYESDHGWRPDHRFSVVVGAWRDGGGTITQLFVMTIGNVNESTTGFTWAQQPIGVNQWRNAASGLITVNVNENNAVGMAVGQFAATDGDQVAVTYNLGGTDAAYFSINNNGALTLKSSLNYEDSVHTAKNYSVVVTATSTDGSPAVSSLFVVSLGNVDDNATVWSGTPATGVAVNETAGITNTVVLSTRVSLADFRAIDGDGQTVKYSLAGDTAGMFSIDSNGVLYRTRNVDYETSQHQFSVTVWAWGAANTDGIANDGAGINKLFILTINNVNEFGTGFTWAQQPIGTNQWRNGASGLVTVGVNENNAMGMAVGQFAATDGDQVAVTYNLGGTDAAYFSINNNGALTLKSSLDYESTHVGKNYSVVVTATSTDGSPAVSSLFVVSLGNVDDNATVWSGTPATGVAVNETAGITNTVVLSTRVSLADFRAIDGDGQTVKYSLAGDTAGMFSIDSNGVLYRTRNVDYETSQHQFSVTVWAWGAANTDGIANDGAGINKLFILTINNVNELGTGFTWAQQPIGVNQWRNGASGLITVGVSENNAMGMAVGQFAATDGDGVSVTYSLSGADAGNFSINNNGALTLKSSLDYESRVGKNYSVVVTATSTDGSPAVSSLFVVSLQDNTKEFVWTNNPTGATLAETAALAGASVADFNIGGGTVGTAFVEGTGSGYWLVQGFGDVAQFNLNQQTGVLTLRNARDYETDHAWRPDHRFSVAVGAWRDGGGAVSQVFVLTVTDVNEATTFQWQAQPMWGQNSAGAWNNWAAASDTRYLNIAENNAGAGSQVAKFKAVDPDIGTYVTYDLGGTDATYFSIDSNGRLYLASNLDYESAHAGKVYSVVVTAKSTDASPAITNLVVITLGNVDDNATAWSSTQASGIAVAEASRAIANGTALLGATTAVASFRALDADGQTVTYSLAGDDKWMFSIDSNGTLYRTNDVDYETSTSWRASHQFSVTVVARGTASNGVASPGAGISQLFILTINNVNEFATGFTWAQQPIGVNQWRNAASGLITVNVNENNAVGMAVGQFAATDGDGVAVTYDLSGADAGYFNINNNGTLTLRSSLDYESTHVGKNYSVTVVATSTDGSSAVNSLFVVSLNNVDDNATAWSSTPATGILINEKEGISQAVALGVVASVANFKALDADGQTVTYGLAGDDKWMFSIDSNGTLYRTNDVDYETSTSWRASHQFSVTVLAGGTASGITGAVQPRISSLFILTINAVDEAPVWSATPLGTKLLVEADGATYNYTDTFTIPASHGTTSAGIIPGNFNNYANGAVVTVPFDVGVGTSHAGLTQSNAYIFWRVAGDSAVHEAQGGVTFAKGTKLTAFQIGLKYSANGIGLYQFYSGDFVAPLNAPGRLNIAGGIVATFAAVDPEGAGVQYSVSGTDANRFIIDGNGKLILTQSLDFDTAGGANYSVVLVATDGTGHATSQNFVLSLGNSNDEFAWSGTQTAGVSLLELTGTQAVTARPLATFTAYDSDANGGGYTPQSGAGNVSYVLDGTKLDSKYFTINKDTGVLSFVSAVDAENGHGQLYSITIWANETKQTLGTPWISQNFVLTIGDVDESAITWKDSNSHPVTGTVTESVNQTQHYNVGQVYPFDLIIPVSPFTWFDISGTGILGAYGATPPLYANGYSVTLPYDIVITGDSMQADQRRVMVRNSDGSITMRGGVADGIDSASAAPYSYTIAAGSVIVGYGAYDSSGYSAYLKNFNFDINVSKTEQRIVTLAGGIDVLSPTTALQDFFFTATDSDVSNIIYSVSGTEAANFTVASDVGGKGIGKLTYVGSLDYETTSHTHTVTVVATSGNNKVTQLFILSVTGLNDEAAVWTSSSANGAISENNVAGVALATFLATDPDGAGVTYSLSGTDANLFSLSSSGGGLQLISALNYEGTYNGHNGHVFSVIVNAWGTAGGAVWGFGGATTKLFVLSLGNVDEFATGFVSTPSTGIDVNENNAVGLTVGNFRATDGDGVAVTYDVSGTDAGYFSIDTNGNLKLRSVLDYESSHVGKNYSVTVVAKSTDGSAAVNSAFVLSLGNVNDNATTIGAMHTSGAAVAKSAAVAGLSVAHFELTDPDGTNFEYNVWNLAGSTDANSFSMDSVGGLHIKTALTGSTKAFYTMVVGGHGTSGGAGTGAAATWVSQTFVFSLNTNAQLADHVAYIDGTTATHAVNVGGIIGHDDAGNIDYANVQFHGVNYTDKVITHNVAPDGLQSTTVDYVVRGISDLESLRISFNGFTDTDGSKRNHWFFVQDDATDHSGHIVFDADGQNVNLHSFTDGVGVTGDQINLLAGSNYGIDGDFAKPADLNLNLASDPLHQNIAGALTFDQFLALLGGSQHISFV